MILSLSLAVRNHTEEGYSRYCYREGWESLEARLFRSCGSFPHFPQSRTDNGGRFNRGRRGSYGHGLGAFWLNSYRQEAEEYCAREGTIPVSVNDDSRAVVRFYSVKRGSLLAFKRMYTANGGRLDGNIHTGYHFTGEC
jgi:hypothetical protein